MLRRSCFITGQGAPIQAWTRFHADAIATPPLPVQGEHRQQRVVAFSIICSIRIELCGDKMAIKTMLKRPNE